MGLVNEVECVSRETLIRHELLKTFHVKHHEACGEICGEIRIGDDLV